MRTLLEPAWSWCLERFGLLSDCIPASAGDNNCKLSPGVSICIALKSKIGVASASKGSKGVDGRVVGDRGGYIDLPDSRSRRFTLLSLDERKPLRIKSIFCFFELSV